MDPKTWTFLYHPITDNSSIYVWLSTLEADSSGISEYTQRVSHDKTADTYVLIRNQFSRPNIAVDFTENFPT
ncbi:hypothetical protein AYI70_g5255 [Smittium culicis]|uniref:Uncharacterized protein n=1 Tax=Smittium culicis TaxID=133412 RepID=A0A1R1XVI0_9FUNG|nr:hypothetical protein AYI70_g5255 [Smittium culicis]